MPIINVGLSPSPIPTCIFRLELDRRPASTCKQRPGRMPQRPPSGTLTDHRGALETVVRTDGMDRSLDTHKLCSYV
jgi:hypothetical protein